MAENGNGSDEVIIGEVVSAEDIVRGFELAKQLGVEGFGQSSAIGGLLLLVEAFLTHIESLEERTKAWARAEEAKRRKLDEAFDRLQKSVGQLQKKVGFQLPDISKLPRSKLL